MIKDQCKNCRMYGKPSCKQNVVYNGSSCEHYAKKVDLTKNTDTQNVSSTLTDSTKPYCNPVEKSTNTSQQEQSSFIASLFTFKGRIRRTRYWLTNIIISLLLIPANLEGDNMSDGVALFTILIYIPSIWILLATCIKRLHDLGKSGWMSLLTLIPLLNLFIGIYMGFFKGDENDNQYGPNPY